MDSSNKDLAALAKALGREMPEKTVPKKAEVKDFRPSKMPALVAASESYCIGDPPRGRLIRPDSKECEEWASECWEFFHHLGEVHYVATQYARAISRARFYIAEYDQDEDKPEGRREDNVPREVSADSPVAELSRGLLGGETCANEILFSLAVQQFVSGQSLLTITDVDENESTGVGQEWKTYSDRDFRVDNAQLKKTARGEAVSPYKVDMGPDLKNQQLPKGTLTIHMWDRDPGFGWSVDSAMRAALPYMRELAHIDQYVQATLLSRIATAGILKLPAEAKIVTPQQGIPEGVDPLTHQMSQVAQVNISTPGTAAQVVPIMVWLPEGQDIEHISLDYPLNEMIINLRELDLNRIAMSLDMAPEVMSGFANIKYSNADFVNSQSIKTHIWQRVAAIASALTKHWVRPAIKKLNLDPSKYLVRWDLSELEVKPDRSTNAIALYDRGEIDGETLRIETGIRDGRPPEGEELVRQIAYRAASIDPSLLQVIAPLLGIEIPQNLLFDQQQPVQELEEGFEAPDPGQGRRSTFLQMERPNNQVPAYGPTGQDPGFQNIRNPQTLRQGFYPQAIPTKGTRAPSRTADAAEEPEVPMTLVAACDIHVAQALARAGSAWRRKKKQRLVHEKDEAVSLYLKHAITADRDSVQAPREYAMQLAGDLNGISRTAQLHGADPDCLYNSVMMFVSDLIVERTPYDQNNLAAAIKECVVTS